KSYFYLTDISNIELEEKDGKKSSWIEIFRIGKWNHQKYGVIEGTKKLFNDFIENWKSNVLGRDIAIDRTHNPEDGATGWIKDMEIVGDRLKALIEWTPFGIELIEQKGFKYFSPEYRDSYTDKESGKEHKNVLFGGALTLRPYLTNLAPIILSEDMDVFQKYENNILTDDLKDEMWLTLQEYVDYDADKIESITKAVKDYIKEATNEMAKDNNKEIISNIVKTHLDSMMHELMNNMCWIKNYPPTEMKSNH
ncbi:MAG: phage protease, partial [Thermodesulfobacteriota bacterium]